MDASDIKTLDLLFEVGEWWENYWRDMPEFVQEDLQPLKSLLINFATREDMDAFARLVGQRITPNTKSIWYPKAEIGRYANKRYADES